MQNIKLLSVQLHNVKMPSTGAECNVAEQFQQITSSDINSEIGLQICWQTFFSLNKLILLLRLKTTVQTCLSANAGCRVHNLHTSSVHSCVHQSRTTPPKWKAGLGGMLCRSHLGNFWLSVIVWVDRLARAALHTRVTIQFVLRVLWVCRAGASSG